MLMGSLWSRRIERAGKSHNSERDILEISIFAPGSVIVGQCVNEEMRGQWTWIPREYEEGGKGRVVVQ